MCGRTKFRRDGSVYAEILLVSANEQLPRWNPTQDFDFHVSFITGMSFCIGIPIVTRIALSTAEI